MGQQQEESLLQGQGKGQGQGQGQEASTWLVNFVVVVILFHLFSNGFCSCCRRVYEYIIVIVHHWYIHPSSLF
jgi:hypothetical protein